MKQNTAPMSTSIKAITGFVFLLLIVMLYFAQGEPGLYWAVLGLLLIIALCYLYSPVAFEITDNHLYVVNHFQRKNFGAIQSARLIKDEKAGFGLRLWGNGGLFSATGIFWSKAYGVFRAYITTGDRSTYVMVETTTHKVMISPENAERFLSFIHN